MKGFGDKWILFQLSNQLYDIRYGTYLCSGFLICTVYVSVPSFIQFKTKASITDFDIYKVLLLFYIIVSFSPRKKPGLWV